MDYTKICLRCGRIFEWRKKWENCWDTVQYCSDKCRKFKLSKDDEALEETILELLNQRPNTSTICPSEAARLYFGENAWRDKMEATRQAARRLVAKHLILICQKGQIVDPSTAKGPIRLKKQP